MAYDHETNAPVMEAGPFTTDLDRSGASLKAAHQ